MDMTYWSSVGQSTPEWTVEGNGSFLRVYACHSTLGIQTRGTVFINDVSRGIMWITGNGSWSNYIPFQLNVNILMGDRVRITLTSADVAHNTSVALQGSGAWYCNMNKFEMDYL
jgi:hypothetical protein